MQGEDWSPFVVTDSKMITGQNPQVIPLTLLAILYIMGAALPYYDLLNEAPEPATSDLNADTSSFLLCNMFAWKIYA